MNFRNLFRKTAKISARVPARPVHSDEFLEIAKEHKNMYRSCDINKLAVYNLFYCAYRAGNMRCVAVNEYPSIRKQLPTPVEYVFFSPKISKTIYVRETYPRQNVGMYMVHIEGYREVYFDKYNLAAMRAARLVARAEQNR